MAATSRMAGRAAIRPSPRRAKRGQLSRAPTAQSTPPSSGPKKERPQPREKPTCRVRITRAAAAMKR